MTLLRWHLGLGDALICCGLVRTLVSRGHRLILPCWAHNRISVETMFRDLRDHVSVRVVTDDKFPKKEGEIAIGVYGVGFDRERWDESFYRQAGVPFVAKWEAFEIGADVDFYGLPNPDESIFVHDDPSRGFRIDIEGYRPAKTDCIFDHFSVLSDAGEIHCINSSFAILADLIDAPGKKVLHRYARPDGGALPIFGREWRILAA